MAGKSHGHATQGSCVVVGEDSYHTYKYVFQSQRGAPVGRLRQVRIRWVRSSER